MNRVLYIAENVATYGAIALTLAGSVDVAMYGHQAYAAVRTLAIYGSILLTVGGAAMAGAALCRIRTLHAGVAKQSSGSKAATDA